jgi:hypothetical protein
MAVFKPSNVGEPRNPWTKAGQVYEPLDDMSKPDFGQISLGGIPGWLRRRWDELYDGATGKIKVQGKAANGGVPETPQPTGASYGLPLMAVERLEAAYALALREAEGHGFRIKYVPLEELQGIARQYNTPIRDSEGNDLTGFETGGDMLYLRGDLLVNDLYFGLRKLGHEKRGHRNGHATEQYEMEFARDYLERARRLPRDQVESLRREYYRRVEEVAEEQTDELAA